MKPINKFILSVIVGGAALTWLSEAALACGATTLLEKPVDREKLIAALVLTPDAEAAPQCDPVAE